MMKISADALMDCKAPIVQDAADGVRQAKSGIAMFQ